MTNIAKLILFCFLTNFTISDEIILMQFIPHTINKKVSKDMKLVIKFASMGDSKQNFTNLLIKQFGVLNGDREFDSLFDAGAPVVKGTNFEDPRYEDHWFGSWLEKTQKDQWVYEYNIKGKLNRQIEQLNVKVIGPRTESNFTYPLVADHKRYICFKRYESMRGLGKVFNVKINSNNDLIVDTANLVDDKTVFYTEQVLAI